MLNSSYLVGRYFESQIELALLTQTLLIIVRIKDTTSVGLRDYHHLRKTLFMLPEFFPGTEVFTNQFWLFQFQCAIQLISGPSRSAEMIGFAAVRVTNDGNSAYPRYHFKYPAGISISSKVLWPD